jgi:hypothetical protein
MSQISSAIPLEKQLQVLANAGITLNPGISVDDLLYSWDREEYESEPYNLLLFMMGSEVEREPWGRYISDRVWRFDTETISQSGDYTKIISRLCKVAGRHDYLTDVHDSIDFETGIGWVEYRVDGNLRKWEVEVNDDWVDSMVLSYIMDDIEDEQHRFYYQDNGQVMVLLYLTDESALLINDASGCLLQPVVFK